MLNKSDIESDHDITQSIIIIFKKNKCLDSLISEDEKPKRGFH